MLLERPEGFLRSTVKVAQRDGVGDRGLFSSRHNLSLLRLTERGDLPLSLSVEGLRVLRTICRH